MKKIISLTCFFAVIQSGFAQTKNDDSLNTLDPIEKFSRIIKRSEQIFVNNGQAFDSGTIIQIHQIAQQLKNDSLLAISYNWIGSYLAFGKGDNVAALEYFFKAIPLAEKVKDKRRLSSLYFDIALVYFALNDNEKAIDNIRKGGENLPDPSSPMHDFMLVQYQRDLTQYYLFDHQPDSALHYAQAMLETSRHLKSISFEYVALYLNGEANAQMNDKEMAEVFFKKAMVLNDSIITLNISRVQFYTGYTGFLLSSGRIPEAHRQALDLLQIATRDNNDNIKLAADSLLKNVFDAMHKTDSAYYYLKQQTAINASIFNHNNINRVQALAFNERLRSMEETAKQAEEAKQRNENIQYILMALGIIFLLIVYLLLSRSFITNLKLIEFFGVVALLIVFEFLNLLLHPFLENITHHVPVFMLLSLVCIAALLVPLHHRLEKWSTAKLVEKNKKIRLAAAKRTIEKLGVEN